MSATCREQRREQHAGEAGEHAGQHPRRHAHPVGVDAGELGHPRALDHRPHPQPERRVPEQQRSARPRPTTVIADRREVVAADEHRRRTGCTTWSPFGTIPCVPYCGFWPNQSFRICGIATSRPSTVTSLRDRRRGAQIAEQHAVEEEPEQRRDDDHRDDERERDRPVVPDAQRRSRPRRTTNACAPNARLKTPDVL